MRTTLTLDDDVARRLRERARRSGASFKEVVNATLRRGLRSGEKPSPRLPRFVVEPKACGFRSGVDPLRLNQLNDELEMEEFHRARSVESPRR
ncbi:MAG TPA: ribbon-helix-helix protein, CopG family [Thermoanaerobaculia bacterium]|nr:ribbon-helix-helix protein, CopG family [Thermoanaerobaculia bacterium]